MVITLPYTITSAGNYRIGGDWVSNTANQQGLTVNASHVTVDGQNYRLNVTYAGSGKPVAVYVGSQTDVTLENINVTGSYIGFKVENSTSVTVDSCTVSNTRGDGIQFVASSGFRVYNCTLQDIWTGISLDSNSNFRIASTSVNHTSYDNGIYGKNCENFTISNVNVANSSWNGFCFSTSSNYVLKDSSVNGALLRFDSGGHHGGQGFLGEAGQNITVSGCVFDKNGGTAIYAQNVTGFNVANNRATNNAQAATVYLSNATFSGNYFASNGLDDGAYCGGFQSTDSNCTVIDNTFTDNYDAVIWETHQNSYSNTLTVQNNLFQGNRYSFFFDYTLAAGATNQKLYFSNNLVNDTAYVDPVGLAEYTNSSFADRVLNLNGTLESGIRVYGNGPYIGGNYWAHPDGTGPSQTGADVDRDGFLDTKFSLFSSASIGNAYDYLPLSTGYMAPATPTPVPTTQSTATVVPTSAVTPTPTPTSSPTPTSTAIPTPPTATPATTPEATHSNAETPWLPIVIAALAVIAVVSIGMWIISKRKNKPS